MQRTSDEEWMELALTYAQKAFDMNEVPVGAIIVYKGECIAAAHNLRESHQDPTAHAELLALRIASQHIGSWRLEECTLYVTLEPCPMCAGALWLSRIERCVFGTSDPKSGYLGSLNNLMEEPKLNHHYQIEGGVLADDCADILRTFFRRIRKNKSSKQSSSE